MAFTNKKGLSEEEITKETMKGYAKLVYCLALLVLTFYLYWCGWQNIFNALSIQGVTATLFWLMHFSFVALCGKLFIKEKGATPEDVSDVLKEIDGMFNTLVNKAYIRLVIVTIFLAITTYTL